MAIFQQLAIDCVTLGAYQGDDEQNAAISAFTKRDDKTRHHHCHLDANLFTDIIYIILHTTPSKKRQKPSLLALSSRPRWYSEYGDYLAYACSALKLEGMNDKRDSVNILSKNFIIPLSQR